MDSPQTMMMYRANIHSIKYWIFDIFIVLSVVSAVSCTLRSFFHRGMPSESTVSPESMSDAIMESMLEDEKCLWGSPSTLLSESVNDGDNNSFRANTVHNVTPTERRTTATSSATTTCDLRNIGILDPVPCTIISKSQGPDGSALYVVSYQLDGKTNYIKMPVDNVVNDNNNDNNGNNVRYEAGDAVELYAPGSSQFAFPATVIAIHHSDDDGSGNGPIKYDVLHRISNRLLEDVDEEFVHPYKSYENGTPGYCNVGNNKSADGEGGAEIKMVSCTVLSHSEEKFGPIVYEVSLDYGSDGSDSSDQSLRGAGETTTTLHLPFSRIQRIIAG